ncbi:MAG: outer membrane beta-barrel protein [Pseudomonadota bacterium]
MKRVLRVLLTSAAAVFGAATASVAMDGDFLRFHSNVDGMEMDTVDFDAKHRPGMPRSQVIGLSWSDGVVFGALEAERRSAQVQAWPVGTAQRIDRSSTLSIVAGVHASPNVLLFGRVGFERARIAQGIGMGAGSYRTEGMRYAFGADYSIGEEFWLRAEVAQSRLENADVAGAEDMGMRLAFIRRF